MDYYTGDYFNNSTIITLLPVRNDMQKRAVITRKQAEQIARKPLRSDVVNTRVLSPSPHPTSRKTIHWIVLLGRVTRGEGIKPPPRNQRFRSSRKGWTFCAFSLLFTPSAIRHAVSRGSYFAGSTSVPSPPPRRWEGKITVTHPNPP